MRIRDRIRRFFDGDGPVTVPGLLAEDDCRKAVQEYQERGLPGCSKVVIIYQDRFGHVNIIIGDNVSSVEVIGMISLVGGQ